MSQEKWMTSGRSRLKARQKNSFGQRAQRRAKVVAPEAFRMIPNRNDQRYQRDLILSEVSKQQQFQQQQQEQQQQRRQHRYPNDLEIISGELGKSCAVHKM